MDQACRGNGFATSSICFPSQFQLANENALLNLARRMVVVVVETDFAHGHDPGVSNQLTDLVGVPVGETRRLVRVRARSNRSSRDFPQGDGRFQIIRTRAAAHGQ